MIHTSCIQFSSPQQFACTCYCFTSVAMFARSAVVFPNTPALHTSTMCERQLWLHEVLAPWDLHYLGGETLLWRLKDSEAARTTLLLFSCLQKDRLCDYFCTYRLCSQPVFVLTVNPPFHILLIGQKYSEHSFELTLQVVSIRFDNKHILSWFSGSLFCSDQWAPPRGQIVSVA